MPRRKYRYMDSNLTQRRRGLEEKIPDIKKTLSMVEFLRDRRVRPMLPPISFSLSVFFPLPDKCSDAYSRKGKEQRRRRARMMLTTSRKNSMTTTVGSPRRLERHLNLPTRSTRRPSSKKRTLYTYGSGYVPFVCCHPFLTLLPFTCTGQCYAVLQNTCSHRTIKI